MRFMKIRLIAIAVLSAGVARSQEWTKALPVSGGDMAAHLLTKVDPVYPPAARAAHVQGYVVLHALISAEGRVESLTVVSGPEMLRDAVVTAVKQWTYQPIIFANHPRRVDTTITVNAGMEPSPGSAAQGLPPGRVRIFPGVMAAQAVRIVRPDLRGLPRSDKQVPGTMVMHAVIGINGAVKELTMISGAAVLQERTLAAVRQWQYKPYVLNGEPFEVDTTIALNIDFGG